MLYVSSISSVNKVNRNIVRKSIDGLDAEQFKNYLRLSLMYSKLKTSLKNLQYQEVEKKFVEGSKQLISSKKNGKEP